MAQVSRPNPFQTLYFTEALTDPELYWDLFSPEILTGEAQRLFREGNVVLLGSNGTGKTMLLRLFAPEVQAAFLRHRREIPIPESSRKFLGVGINFVTAGVGALGRRPINEDKEENLFTWSLLFGDFLNCFLMGELLKTFGFLQSAERTGLTDFLGAKVDTERLDDFAKWLAGQECWFGALDKVNSFDTLRETLAARVYAYRAFANWNVENFPAYIFQTKSEVGSPLSEARVGLVKFGILEPSVPLMITVDQYETLTHIDYETKGESDESVGRAFCRVVNSLLAARNSNISYKVGVRPYSWGREMRAFGTDARLELARDYQHVNLDEILRRKEDQSTWIFPRFARDVASRRMAWTFGGNPEIYSWPERVLEELTAEEEIGKYCAQDQDRLKPHHPDLPVRWQTFLSDLYLRDKLQAKMAEVWIWQVRGRDDQLPDDPPGKEAETPWGRQWWQKERREALLMQIASACQQRRIYGGWDTLLTLSGYNILVFLSLCREIWDTNERTRSRRGEESEAISAEVQTHAIRLVSSDWLNKQSEFPGGAQRQDFVTRLGIGIRKALLADQALVYPGHNGFSLLLEEYEAPEALEVRNFLENATDFGALIASPHTTKERDRKPRKKWYLFPILCPNFEIPAVRTKEPYYSSLSEVRSWLAGGRPAIKFYRPLDRRNGKHQIDGSQRNLFSSPEEEDK